MLLYCRLWLEKSSDRLLEVYVWKSLKFGTSPQHLCAQLDLRKRLILFAARLRRVELSHPAAPLLLRHLLLLLLFSFLLGAFLCLVLTWDAHAIVKSQRSIQLCFRYGFRQNKSWTRAETRLVTEKYSGGARACHPTCAGQSGADPVSAGAHALVALHPSFRSVLKHLVLQGALCRRVQVIGQRVLF